MNEDRTRPDLADPFRHLLAVVTGVLRPKRGWSWLGAPLALLAWIRGRRERREAAAALEQFKRLIEQFLEMLEAFRAGKLVAAPAPAAGEYKDDRRPLSLSAPRTGRGPRSGRVRCPLPPNADLVAHPALRTDEPPGANAARRNRCESGALAFAGVCGTAQKRRFLPAPSARRARQPRGPPLAPWFVFLKADSNAADNCVPIVAISQ